MPLDTLADFGFTPETFDKTHQWVKRVIVDTLKENKSKMFAPSIWVGRLTPTLSMSEDNPEHDYSIAMLIVPDLVRENEVFQNAAKIGLEVGVKEWIVPCVYIATEAWYIETDTPNTEKLRPSENPFHKECISVQGLCTDGRAAYMNIHVDRDEDGNLVPGNVIESFADDDDGLRDMGGNKLAYSFLTGYLSGLEAMLIARE